MSGANKARRLIPISLIFEAVSGDSIALDIVVQCFDGYIGELSTEYHYDDEGNYSAVVDEWLKGRLRSKLTEAIHSFKISVSENNKESPQDNGGAV